MEQSSGNYFWKREHLGQITWRSFLSYRKWMKVLYLYYRKPAMLWHGVRFGTIISTFFPIKEQFLYILGLKPRSEKPNRWNYGGNLCRLTLLETFIYLFYFNCKHLHFFFKLVGGSTHCGRLCHLFGFFF